MLFRTRSVLTTVPTAHTAQCRYGAGLPPPEDSAMDYSRVLNYDKRQQDSNWATITSTEFIPPCDSGEKVQLPAIGFVIDHTCLCV